MGSMTRNDTPGGDERHTPVAAATAARRGWLRALHITTRTLAFGAKAVAWTALAAIVVLLGAISLIPKLSENRTLVITGRSMTETMPIGSAAVVAPIDAADIHVGDVISFDHPGASTEIVSHRVIEVLQVKGRTVFRTKGDHNAKADDWKVDYVGQRGWKVVAHAPYLGRVMYAAQSHTARIVLVFVPVAALLLLTLTSIWGGAPVDDTRSRTQHDPEASAA